MKISGEFSKTVKRMLALVLLFVAMTATASTTKLISDDATGGDCALIGEWNTTTKTCMLSADTSETIAITGNSIILDGNGHSVKGDWTGENGIQLMSITGAIVKNVKVEGFKKGIYLSASSGNTLSSNNFSNNSYYGMHLSTSNSNSLVDNIANSNSRGGIYLAYSNSNELMSNEVSSTVCFDSDVICSLTAFQSGIVLFRSSNNNFITNSISYNYVSSLCNGVLVQNGSNYNTFTRNNMINNYGSDACDYGTNTWDNGAVGNYYSSYAGSDSDFDGIGDTSYAIPGGTNIDNYPLMTPYTAPFTATILEPAPDQILKRGKTINDLVSVKFSGSASGGSSSYTYTWYLDGVSIPVGGENLHYNVSYGEHTLKLVVEDNNGAMAYSDEINFKIATTIAVIPVKLGVDEYHSSDDELTFKMIDLATYYRQQSHGKENVVPKLLVGWSGAARLTMTYDQYIEAYKNNQDFFDESKEVPREVQIGDRTLTQIVIDAAQGENLEQYNAVVVVFAGDDATENRVQPGACIANSRYPEIGDTGRCGNTPWALIPENRILNGWVHEVGHAAFDIMDQYFTSEFGDLGGNSGLWGIMGQASASGGGYIGLDPLSPMDPISKRDAGWINENWLGYGDHQPINLITEEINPGIYFLDPGSAGQHKFAIEGRNPPDNVLSDSWCASGNCDTSSIIPNRIVSQNPTKGIELYKYYKNADTKLYSKHYSMDKIYYISNQDPALNTFDPLLKMYSKDQTITLKPNSPYDTYNDIPAHTRFRVTEENGQLYLDISKLFYSGMKVLVEDSLLEKSYGSLASYTVNQTIPYIDLKVYNSAGQMVGMNYTSGLYEMEIDGVNTSGNIQGGSQWIAYPDNMDLYAVLDTTPLKNWAEETNTTLPENITIPMYMIEYDSNGIRTETSPTNITVNTENTTTTVQPEILLPPVRYINGTVIDNINKTGIGNVTVSTNISNLTVTDEFGNYSLGVPAGTYELKAKFDPRYYLNTSVIVSTSDTAAVWQDIELTEKPKGKIQGGVKIK